MPNFQITSSLSRIAIIGGGRWARVIAGALIKILPLNTILSIHSKNNASALKSWIERFSFEKNITVSEEWPVLARDCKTAVIVANAARDHAYAVRRALESGAHVLVEKPVALNVEEVEKLIDLSKISNCRLASAHVFMFASYLEKFAAYTSTFGPIKSVHIRWTDPLNESRYGEKKQYDPGLPIYADCLPHVTSILWHLSPNETPLVEDVKFFRGGAYLFLKISLGRIPCTVELERNSKQRQRFVEIISQKGQAYQLDFSAEPGQIFYGSRRTSGDSEWGSSSQPLERMLSAFLECASGGKFDSRLDCTFGLSVCRLIDQTKEYYLQAQSEWLIGQFEGIMIHEPEDLEYALGELIQLDGRLAYEDLVHRIRKLQESFTGYVDERWLGRVKLV